MQHDSLDPYVELVGKVENDCSVTVHRIVNFGVSFGIKKIFFKYVYTYIPVYVFLVIVS